MKTVFIRITKIHSITLIAKISLCSLSHKLFPRCFRRRLLYLASKPKDRGRRGGRWGGGTGQKEKKRDTQRERVREWESKRGWEKKKEANKKRQKNSEEGVSRRKNVCAMCLYVFERNHDESMGQNNNTTLPFRPSTNLDVHTPSLPANTPPLFDICFAF